MHVLKILVSSDWTTGVLKRDLRGTDGDLSQSQGRKSPSPCFVTRNGWRLCDSHVRTLMKCSSIPGPALQALFTALLIRSPTLPRVRFTQSKFPDLVRRIAHR
ncbi:hypothetical protein, variant [Exophiala oligosperma]|uniref:Uncharacterized protein n=1 Tax=Exophiala oligosperma TaxID=215243 RepID=A0A0D2DDT8_9EURO|nr:hypothetical protein, variant [Exophiala oligosperma]KIW40580.1 hypothetical protein, variant [Exophiala oligosperma]